MYLPFEKNVHLNVEEDGWYWHKLGKKTWHITEINEADALWFLATWDRDKPFFLNVAFYTTHVKDRAVRQYMPQNTSMGWYTDAMVPIPRRGRRRRGGGCCTLSTRRTRGRRGGTGGTIITLSGRR